MDTTTLRRRELVRLLGAGATLGVLGTGTAAAGGGRYIVGTRSPAARREAQRQARSVHRVLDFGAYGSAVAGTFSEQALRGLSRRPDVDYVEPDGRMYAISIDSTDAEVPWGVDRVDAEKVHATSDGTGAHVAIIDSGIDSDHPDLPNVGAGKAFVSARGSYAKPWDDDNGHGTHCAGSAAAVDDGAGVVGVAPGATLHAVKVLDKNGSGSYSDVAAGIKYVADQSWHVGSLSLGGPLSDTIKNACQYAYDGGVLLVAAAGNDGAGTADAHAPAAYETVVSVGATDDTDAVASFSSTGSTVEMSAPGVDIKSTYPGGGYRTYSGTSMACPHVSGGGAYLMAAGYTNADARTAFKNTAEDLGAAGRDNKYGHGLLDVEAIVAAIGGSGGDSDTNPAITTDAASDVTATSATLNGTLDDLGGAESADVGFEYRESGASNWTDVAAGTLSAVGAFSTGVSGLIDGAAYEYRAVATASDGDTAAGSAVSFTTTDDPVAVTTGSASNAGDTDATLAGSLDDLGGASSADAGFEYRPVGATDWAASATQTLSAVGGYTQDVTGLASGTDYEFRAVATATDGDSAVGSPATFTTTGETTSSPPSVSATATEAGSPNPHAEFTVDWSVADTDGDLTKVVIDVTATDGSPGDSHTYTYTGSTGDSGSDYFEFKHAGGQTYDVTVTATDSGNQSTVWSDTLSS